MKKIIHVAFWLLAISTVLVLFYSHVLAADTFQEQRQAMVAAIKADVKATSDFLQQDSLDERVFDALGSVPRHEFVPEEQRSSAYENRPLPIGYGQTISQPYIVAVMTDLLKLKKTDRILEVGTGSGYQAAILAALADSVYSIEIIEGLGKQAAANLKRAGFDRVHTRIGDGYYGWESEAPFDGIVVTAVASHVPPPLIKQLKPGGRMIIPVGTPFMTQYLILVTKNADASVSTRQIAPVRFVPLLGGH
ncbi:MAG: protein-L-isoaspartate(D-aspartate) O-methyltransferase [Methylomonas sp.]|jgi:protein-L-isoaspartate(D-aspartate) O-methyltransferase